MKRTYIKFKQAIQMLNEGWEIYTDRGCGGAPYTPLFFRLYKKDQCLGEVHHKTIHKLINEGIINGNNVKHEKYELIKP